MFNIQLKGCSNSLAEMKGGRTCWLLAVEKMLLAKKWRNK
jgi:hypothetical protein